MTKWHYDVMNRYTRIYSDSRKTSPIMRTPTECHRHFDGSEVDKRKYNDLPVVKRRHATTAGILTRQAAPNARSRHETRSNMLDTYCIAVSELRAPRRRRR